MPDKRSGYEVLHCADMDQLKDLLSFYSHTPRELIDSKQHTVFFQEYLASLSAQSIIVENQYTDRDYLDDFVAYYVRCFAHYSKTCMRLHFFDVHFEKQDMDGLLEGKPGNLTAAELQQHYLGFMVVKPIPETVIGRTCLKPWLETDHECHFPVIRNYTANLFGIPLSVETIAFQEQDGIASACATSALWSVLHYTGDRFGYTIPSPVEITKTASQGLPISTRALPSSGLTMGQMAQAGRHVGLEQIAANVDNYYALQGTIYPYLRGKFPVVLGLVLYDVSTGSPTLVENDGRHAVAVTGYRLGGSPDAVPADDFCLVAFQMDRLFVHDDQLGPFSHMDLDGVGIPAGCGEAEPGITCEPVEEDSDDMESLSTAWEDANGNTGSIRAVPDSVLIPLYHKIRIPLASIYDILISSDYALKRVESGLRLAWDVYLTTVEDFKTHVLEHHKQYGNCSRGLLVEKMPRYMWRATALSAQGTPLLDLLFDATGIEQDKLLVFSVDNDGKLPDLIRRAVADEGMDLIGPEAVVFQSFLQPESL